jgi:hypothetical protein
MVRQDPPPSPLLPKASVEPRLQPVLDRLKGEPGSWFLIESADIPFRGSPQEQQRVLIKVSKKDGTIQTLIRGDYLYARFLTPEIVSGLYAAEKRLSR